MAFNYMCKLKGFCSVLKCLVYSKEKLVGRSKDLALSRQHYQAMSFNSATTDLTHRQQHGLRTTAVVEQVANGMEVQFSVPLSASFDLFYLY